MRLLRLCAQRRHHENRLLRDKLDEGLVEIEALRHGIEALHDVGIYNYRHPLEDAVAHQQALAEISAEMKSRIAEGTAIEVSTRFTFDNSLAKGRRMTSELAKLMLRAYNVEAENCVRYVKAGNLTGAERRLTNNATVDEDPVDTGTAEPGMVVTVGYDNGLSETFLLGVPGAKEADIPVYSVRSPQGRKPARDATGGPALPLCALQVRMAPALMTACDRPKRRALTCAQGVLVIDGSPGPGGLLREAT